MYNRVLKRLAGAAITAIGLALASHVKFSYPEKEFVHLLVIAIAAVISVIGIGIYEDAPRRPRQRRETAKPAHGVLQTGRLTRL
jgi:hypothetical protein